MCARASGGGSDQECVLATRNGAKSRTMSGADLVQAHLRRMHFFLVGALVVSARKLVPFTVAAVAAGGCRWGCWGCWL